MPYRTEWVDPEVFLEHNGVTIYHVYKGDDVECGRRFYWFGTTIHASDDDDDDGESFDVRDLPGAHAALSYVPFAEQEPVVRQLIVAAIDNGRLIDTTPGEDTPNA